MGKQQQQRQPPPQTAKEQEIAAAKASFKVRRSELMSISGRTAAAATTTGKNGKKKKNRRNNSSSSNNNNNNGRTNSSNGQYHPHRASWSSYDNDNDAFTTWCGKLMYLLKQIISTTISILSFGYYPSPKIDHDGSPSDPSNSDSSSSRNATSPTLLTNTIRGSGTGEETETETAGEEGYYDNTAIVGLDCEMVGGGRGGWKSLLARCSVVTLDCIPTATANNNNKCQTVEENTNNETVTIQSSSSSSATTTTTTTNTTVTGPLDQNLIVLYDKYIIPKGKITDYRTEWSGITKDTYNSQSQSNSSDPENNNNNIPIVSFNTCQNEITQLFSSLNGKKVIVVGHALENDFEALEIEHPPSLTRDTAFHPPYMRKVRKKYYPRKLSTLASEELDIEIQQKVVVSKSSSTQKQQQQQQQREVPTLTSEPSGESSEDASSSSPASSSSSSSSSTSNNNTATNSIKNASNIGHSSVEDAAAALRLYWHRAREWERFLGRPLSRRRSKRTRCDWVPLTMYLDGCNLPVGMRGVNFKELMENNTSSSTSSSSSTSNEKRGPTTIPSETFRLTSRKRDGANNSNISTIDWIPAFRSALSSHQTSSGGPKLESISVMFDGAKFGNGNNKSKTIRGLETRVFYLDDNESSNNATTATAAAAASSGVGEEKKRGSIRIEITENGDSADDVLFHRCSTADGAVEDDNHRPGSAFDESTTRNMISLERVVSILSGDDDDDDDGGGEADVLPHYIVIKRKSGGKKTHRRLFDKLHLRRPNEGALCLSALTPGLRKHGLKVARELQRERSVERVIECELRRREGLRFVVVTDDVYLTDRLVGCGVLVLSYNQLTNMF